MKKFTLQFETLRELAAFSRLLNKGYIMNTVNLTLTGPFSDGQIEEGRTRFNARPIETTEKVFSYELAP